MFNFVNFKIVNAYGNHSISLYNKSKFYEVKCEPSYKGDIILLCNKKDVTFDESVNLLLYTNKKVNILGAISLIYYKYSSDFLDYLKECPDNEYKIIKKKCRRRFDSLNTFIEKSDDLLYPQNTNIRNIHHLFINK